MNRAVLENADVRSREMPLQEALASGAMALFGEKYDDHVRVVEAGPSRELCGGTHCHCTGDIGLFLITNEESIGAGIRRIEAVTGVGALREVRETRERLGRAAALLRVPAARVPEALGQLVESREKLQHELEARQRSGIEAAAAGLLGKAESIGAAKLVAANVGEGDVQQLRALSDHVRSSIGSGVVVLGGVKENKPYLVVAVTKDLVPGIDADKVVKAVQGIIDGKGGGRAESASAGGKDAARLAEAIEAARSAVRERLNGGRDRN